MSKQDYEGVARVMARVVDQHVEKMTSREKTLLASVAIGMADYCGSKNASFERVKFLDACKILPLWLEIT